MSSYQKRYLNFNDGIDDHFQGPKKSDLSHFWQMIWQETKEVAVIVMLTQTAEAGREKCYQYFPLDEESAPYRIEPIGDPNESPEGSVEFVESVTDESSRTNIRKLLLTFGKESRTVWHLLFCGWPDFVIPEGQDRAALMELSKLSTTKNNVPNNPRIVHCSAGVGRSGTFIALEYLVAQVKSGAIAEAKDDEDLIFNVVNQLREQRMTMVQSASQYFFLYEVVREELSKWQSTTAADHGTGEPSPKLRRLVKEIQSVFIGGEAGTREESIQDQGKAPITT